MADGKDVHDILSHYYHGLDMSTIRGWPSRVAMTIDNVHFAMLGHTTIGA